MEVSQVTYAEVVSWARRLRVFTTRELADVMRVSVVVAERGVKALLWHRICERLEEDPGYLPEDLLIGYVPLPPGPTHHPHEEPPEVTAPREMGGDPLRVRRGVPIGMGPSGRASKTGNWHPGRTQGPSKAKAKV